MTPLRVGLVCPYSLDVPGGVQSHVRDLAEALIRRGHVVRLLAPGEDSADVPDYVTTAGRALPVRFNGSVARLAFGPRAVSRVRRWLLNGDFDVLHVHEPSSPSVSLIALWASDIPVVATFHYATPRSRVVSSTAALLRPSMEKISARIAVSEAARATLVSHLGGEPVVIPNGVATASFAAASPREEWRAPGPTVGFLGRTDEPRKGLGILLDALPAVLAAHPTARLLVAGRGGAAALQSLPDDVAAHVEALGQVSDADRARLLASVDVYVAPQTGGESFGIVLVEAMAAGAPIVASDLPPFQTILRSGELGELFAVGDSARLAAAVSALLADPVRRAALRDQGRREAADYEWDRLLPDIEAVYLAVRRGSPASPPVTSAMP